ncbi:citrate synthase [Terribacillus saccharophilus]|uniref:Citrate synthase n=1 Tax=Terribacillus saccharophilus TaxID=361277 RepID=A0AAX2E8P1_9BACI|nr:citrate synthase [Terribacillus saccharophilus]
MAVVKGLEGVVAAESKISSIIDDQLTYAGYSIDDLASNSSFEEVIYLLWHDELPTEEQLAQLKGELAAQAKLPEPVIDHLKSCDLKAVHPMAALRTAVSLLGLYDEDAEVNTPEANAKKAIRLQAQIATLVAAFSRIRSGQEPVTPREDYSYAANFLYMFNEQEPKDIEVEAMNKALVLHADHELNASTFTARVCVGTLSDMYSGLTAAIGALKGPLHGGANEAVMEMLFDIGEIDNVEPYLEKKFANKEKIMGMGHRVYKAGDPRAKFLKEMSRELTEISGQTKWYEMSVKVEDIVKREKNLPANVDFYSATCYYSLGIDHDLYTPIFTVSRFSGWIAHILEQYADNRLIRPRAEYVGETHRTYTPVEERV